MIHPLQVLNVGEDSFRYDATVENHPHVRCMDCGRVDDMHDIDDQWEPGPTQEEEQPVVLFHIEFYRDRYYNLLGLASTPFQNWSRCIQRVHVAVK